MNMDYQTLVHVGTELVVIAGMGFWLNRQIGGVREQVSALTQKLSTYEDMIIQQAEVIKQQNEMLRRHSQMLATIFGSAPPPQRTNPFEDPGSDDSTPVRRSAPKPQPPPPGRGASGRGPTEQGPVPLPRSAPTPRSASVPQTTPTPQSAFAPQSSRLSADPTPRQSNRSSEKIVDIDERSVDDQVVDERSVDERAATGRVVTAEELDSLLADELGELVAPPPEEQSPKETRSSAPSLPREKLTPESPRESKGLKRRQGKKNVTTQTNG